MSFHIIILDDKTKEVFAISDKRTMRAESSASGQLFNWKHLNDNARKLFKITDDVYCMTGGIHYIGEYFLKEISKVNHLKPSSIIAHARTINRVIDPPFGTYPMDCVTLFGRYDDGSLFEWLAERDGSEYMKVPDPGSWQIGAGGGSEGTQEKVGEYIIPLIKAGISHAEILPLAIAYASKIDSLNTISPTYDFLHKAF